MLRLTSLVLVLVTLPAVAAAQTAPTYPHRIPAPGGEVIIPSARHQQVYDDVGYAPARRSGDTLYISGALVFRGPGEGNDQAAFDVQVRRTLSQLKRTLETSGATLDDVALISSFHVWDSPHFSGDRNAQVETIARIWREFSTGPRPAWTAVGTTGLLADTGIIEIQLTAHAPKQPNEG